MKNILQKMAPIFPMITLVFCCIVFVFLYKEINFHDSSYKNNETQWKQESERRSGIKLLNNSISKIQKEKDLLEMHFAESSNIVPFLDTMETTGTSAGVKAQVTLVDIAKDGKSLAVEMKASGSFSAIYKFILLLENSPYELEFVSADIQKENSGGSTSMISDWTADIKIKLISFIAQ